MPNSVLDFLRCRTRVWGRSGVALADSMDPRVITNCPFGMGPLGLGPSTPLPSPCLSACMMPKLSTLNSQLSTLNSQL